MLQFSSCNFRWPKKKALIFLQASCERCSGLIKPVFAPTARAVHTLHVGMRPPLSRLLPTSSRSSSPSRVRGVGLELKNPSKRCSSCRISTLLRAQKVYQVYTFWMLPASAARGRLSSSLRAYLAMSQHYSLECIGRRRALSRAR